MHAVDLARLADPEPRVMTAAQRAQFLRSRKMGLFTTRRSSGRPLTVPFGFLFTDDSFDESTPVYLSAGGRRSIVKRLERDNRIGMTVVHPGVPLTAIVAQGVATEVPDPGSTMSLAMLRDGMPTLNSLPADQFDLEKFAANWLGAGRSLIRVDFHHIVGWIGSAPA